MMFVTEAGMKWIPKKVDTIYDAWLVYPRESNKNAERIKSGVSALYTGQRCVFYDTDVNTQGTQISVLGLYIIDADLYGYDLNLNMQRISYSRDYFALSSSSRGNENSLNYLHTNAIRKGSLVTISDRVLSSEPESGTAVQGDTANFPTSIKGVVAYGPIGARRDYCCVYTANGDLRLYHAADDVPVDDALVGKGPGFRYVNGSMYSQYLGSGDYDDGSFYALKNNELWFYSVLDPDNYYRRFAGTKLPYDNWVTVGRHHRDSALAIRSDGGNQGLLYWVSREQAVQVSTIQNWKCVSGNVSRYSSGVSDTQYRPYGLTHDGEVYCIDNGADEPSRWTFTRVAADSDIASMRGDMRVDDEGYIIESPIFFSKTGGVPEYFTGQRTLHIMQKMNLPSNIRWSTVYNGTAFPLHSTSIPIILLSERSS